MSKQVMLKSSDGECFEIEEAVAVHSQTIAHMVEDGCADNEIPLANVKGNILSLVIEYCKKHTDAATVADSSSSSSTTTVEEGKEEKLKKWDKDFMTGMEKSILFDVILAANYLNIKDLLDLSCQTVADMIVACKTPDVIRQTFGIENDFTPEEEEQVRKENQWAFE